MITPDIFNLRGARSTEKYIRINYPEFYNFLIDSFPEDLSFSERVYWYKHNIEIYPTCHSCGKRVNYAGPTRGYYQFCSSKCSNSSQVVKNKKEQTMINNWGSIEVANKERINKSHETIICKYGSVEESYKKRLEKVKQTNLERYGVECILTTNEFKEKARQTLINKYGSVEESYKKRLEKIKQTNLERYGVECILTTNEFKEKARQTNLEKYGVENPAQCESVKNKVKQTNLERYGVEYTFNSKEQLIKTKKKMRSKYGVDYPQQNQDCINKSNETKKIKFLQSHTDIIDVNYCNETIYICKCPHIECNKCHEKIFRCPANIYYDRKRSNIETCTNIFPIRQYRSSGTSLELFVTNILDEYGIEYITNTRKVITPHELDIYIPSKKLAIECNGVYWHSNCNKYKYYHSKKFFNCVDKNIKLLTVWEDDIINYPNNVKDTITRNLGLKKLNITDVTVRDFENCLKLFLDNKEICNLKYILDDNLVEIYDIYYYCPYDLSSVLVNYMLKKYCDYSIYYIGNCDSLDLNFSVENIVSYELPNSIIKTSGGKNFSVFNSGKIKIQIH